MNEQETNSINREKELLGQLVEKAAQKTLTGSFAERNPMLGKMVRCPFCRTRRRPGDPIPCCSSVFIPGTENFNVTPKTKRKNPRLSRNRPPFFLVHQLLVEMEAAPGFKEHEGLAGIVEAQVLSRRKAKAKKYRDMQKKSRKINQCS